MVLVAHMTLFVLGEHDFSHCTRYAEYNTLVSLMKHDECMDIDSDHFGHYAQTAAHCQCRGVNKLQQYHMGSGDGVADHRRFCLIHNPPYNDMYHQFFESKNIHNKTVACRTHHSVWSVLKNITSSGSGHNPCQKDIIYHFKYAYDQYPDNCTCSEITHEAKTDQGHEGVDCHHYDSFNKLLQLGENDGCLSANSVWHYLDELQVKNPACRQNIQRHLARKYNARSNDADNSCTCNERRKLVNHVIHKLRNGSFHACINENGTYRVIEADLFSNIRANGCQNHDYLWTKLEEVQNHCSWPSINHCGKWFDCTEDLIVRAAVQHPTDESDSCVCSKVPSSLLPSTSISTSKATTPAVTTHTTSPIKAPTTAVNTPSTAPISPYVTGTSTEPTRLSTSVTSTHKTLPTIKFACDKLKVVEDIAKSLRATHPNSSACLPNAGGSDDAYVLPSCNTTLPMMWQKGANVMADCESGTWSIPTYTPVSTFDGDSYTPIGAQSGIFLGCYNSGIKIAIQKCNGIPEIVHIEHGVFVNNPKNYYVIV